MRTRRIASYVRGKNVLDFGCGREARTLRAVRASARAVAGYDPCFEGQARQEVDGVPVFGSLRDLAALSRFDLVTSLACFEHIEPELLPQVLTDLACVTTEEALIVGTVPTPPGRPVLEFLSYRLGLIDRSQIEDHKIYYDRRTLAENVARGGWELRRYERFQLGMNSFFVLGKKA
jgi:hypothetical protein